jgi:hypothetical protein
MHLNNACGEKWFCNAFDECGGCVLYGYTKTKSPDQIHWRCDSCDFYYCRQCYNYRKNCAVLMVPWKRQDATKFYAFVLHSYEPTDSTASELCLSEGEEICVLEIGKRGHWSKGRDSNGNFKNIFASDVVLTRYVQERRGISPRISCTFDRSASEMMRGGMLS